ncbi:SprT-like domain-containing protein [Croceimicrobium sp.]|uniref:SprT-like domain-containing protein n=1 Tax=Croceimicrobium sp. TaxID=2828340 RepID=UPI003BAD8AF4
MKKGPDPFAALNKYLPTGSLELLRPLLDRYPLQLKVSKPRKTKFGDYRYPQKGQAHRISVNGDLNPYAFLITLLHEYAHLVAFDKFGQKIKAHGEEWQFCFREIGTPFLDAKVFPLKLERAFRASLARGHASSATDHQLLRVLKEFDQQESTEARTFVEDLEPGAIFVLNGRIFKKGPKSRKRYKCDEVKSGRQFMVHPLAEVGIWKETNEH